MSIDARQQAVLLKDAGILDHFGMEFIRAEQGVCEMEATVKPELINAAGLAHGGLLFALADTACAYAVGSLGTRGATINANMTYVHAATAGQHLVGKAEVVNRSRRLVSLRAEVVTGGADSRLLAHGTFVFMLIEQEV